MGFPENVLTRDEQVARSLHPHWLTVIGPTITGIGLVAAAVIASALTPDDSRGNLIQWAGVALAVVLVVPLVVVPYLRWRTTHYVITTHRVMVRRGILSKAGKDITLSKITDVSFHQSLLDRILRSGSLSIESAGDSADEELRNIPHSDEIQQLINHLIDEDSTTRARRANGRRDEGDDWGGTPDPSERPDRSRRPDRPRLSEE